MSFTEHKRFQVQKFVKDFQTWNTVISWDCLYIDLAFKKMKDLESQGLKVRLLDNKNEEYWTLSDF